jgi:hypothetical protein
VAVGFLVYEMLEFAGVISRSVHAEGRGKRTVWSVLSGRAPARTLSLLGWALYGAFFFSTLLPFCLLAVEQGCESIQLHDGLHGALLCAMGVVLLACALHWQVIFMRLVALRPRVFGGDNDIEAVLTRH